jgi:uncharacterized membrane protein YphA (DoxX/SURF4 family)
VMPSQTKSNGGGSSAVQITARIWIALYKSLFTLARPIADLGIRLYLAQAFVMSSVMAVTTGSMAAGDDMMSGAAMVASGSLGGLFISLGLFTRISSAALIFTIIAQQYSGGGSDSNLFVIALLCWYILRGPDAYAAGVYVYLWADVMVADVIEAFQNSPGGLYDREMAARWRDTILSMGTSLSGRAAFQNFFGRDPDSNALMRRFALLYAMGNFSLHATSTEVTFA